MALSSVRQDTKVDPDKGVYVEMEGIMEVRCSSDDLDFLYQPEDLLYFQRRVREIPEDFCRKDRATTEQAFFYCFVCDCELKSLRPLREHVTGNKHIRKACARKRQILGLPLEPQNAPRIKELKKDRPMVDVGQTLRERLEDCGEPAVGLEYLTEYSNPRNPTDHPMYTCRLEGCKSAWGTSDDLFNHCIRVKHQKNFFRKLNPMDGRIAGLSSADILQMAAEYEEEHGGSEERDYEVIARVKDYEEYIELRDRPNDWSEKEAESGRVGVSYNSSVEVVRGRGEADGGGKRSREEDGLGGQPHSKKQVKENFINNMRNGVNDVMDMVVEFGGIKGDDKYEEIIYYKKVYGDLLSLFDESKDGDCLREVVVSLNRELATVNNIIEEKLERKDRVMKGVSKLMAELEEEIEMYASERSSEKYTYIQNRLIRLTFEMKGLQLSCPANINLRTKYNERLTRLRKEFESRSDSLVEVLRQQMEESAGKPTSQRKEHVDNY